MESAREQLKMFTQNIVEKNEPDRTTGGTGTA
jgi:hypothetical protein